MDQYKKAIEEGITTFTGKYELPSDIIDHEVNSLLTTFYETETNFYC